MKKGLVCVLLMFLMLAPMLVACVQEADIEQKEAEVYTFYFVVEESTTPEAVHEVELALNRTLFYRKNALLKLIALKEDEYDSFIDEKIAEVEAFQLEKKNSKNNSKAQSSEVESSEETEDESSQIVTTGEYWLELMADGGEIELKEPRIDIFVARGYDRYYELASTGKLTAMDEKLNNEAKSLKSSIHSTLLTAVKVNKKTYGIPVNTVIGEYTYLVFDKEMLDKYGYDQNTIQSLEDLSSFLADVKAGEDSIIPLKNTMPSANINFLIEDGSPALVTSSGEVVPSYSNNTVRGFLAMIARYSTAGYFKATDGSTDRCAVSIETGTIDELKAKHADDGREYEYNLYSNPVATNENTIDNVLCISSTVNSSNLTKVSELLTEIYTDSDLMNLLTYGVEDVNYIRNERGQIERLNNDYVVKPENVGNPFITGTLVGEDSEKWTKAIKQNQDAVVSPSLGFTFNAKSFTYTDEENATQTIYEPDYFELMHNVIAEYWPKLMNGSVDNVDFEALLERATQDINEEFVNKLDSIFKNYVLTPIYTERVTNQITASKGPAIRKEVTDAVMEDVMYDVDRELRRKLRPQYEEDYPDASASDITRMLDQLLTDEYVRENISILYTQEEIDEMIEDDYLKELDYEIDDAIDEALSSDQFQRDFEALKNGEDYKKQLDNLMTYDAPTKIRQRFDTLISAELLNYTAEMSDKIGEEVEKAVMEFVAENKDLLGKTEDELLYDLGVKNVKTPENEESQAEEGAEAVKEYEDAYASWFDFLFEYKLKKGYYDVFGSPAG